MEDWRDNIAEAKAYRAKQDAMLQKLGDECDEYSDIVSDVEVTFVDWLNARPEEMDATVIKAAQWISGGAEHAHYQRGGQDATDSRAYTAGFGAN